MECDREIGINPIITDWANLPKTGVKTPKNGSDKNSKKRELNLPKTGVDTPENGSNSSQKREAQKKETNTKEINTKENTCSEPEVSDPQDLVLFKLPLNKSGSFYSVTQTEVNEKKELYQAVDVEQEYRIMLDWLNSNPMKRKTQSGIKSFISRWLAKSQNNPPAQRTYSTQPDTQSTFTGTNYGPVKGGGF